MNTEQGTNSKTEKKKKNLVLICSEKVKGKFYYQTVCTTSW